MFLQDRVQRVYLSHHSRKRFSVSHPEHDGMKYMSKTVDVDNGLTLTGLGQKQI
jgi:hypothetical protein